MQMSTWATQAMLVRLTIVVVITPTALWARMVAGTGWASLAAVFPILLLMYLMLPAVGQPAWRRRQYDAGVVLLWQRLTSAALSKLPASELAALAPSDPLCPAVQRWLAEEDVDPLVFAALARSAERADELAGTVVMTAQLLAA